MKLLVARAHPLDSTQSRSMQMADAFVEGFRQTHPDALVEDINLYSAAVPEIDLDLLSAWAEMRSGEPFLHLSPMQQAKVTLFENYTMQFLSSQLIVVANPLWNMSVPTRLKAWIDTVCRAGVTFRYDTDGRAIGLATGRKVIHLQSSGGYFGGKDPASEYVRTIFTFLGCEVDQLVSEGVDHEPDRADEIMAETLRQAIELGRSQ